MITLHGIGVLLLPLCGWLAGSAVQAASAAHCAALQQALTLLCRIRQEIRFRRADLGLLYRQLQREGLLWDRQAENFRALAPLPELQQEEQACFADCMAGLGRTAAEQECERLEYYIARFEAFLQQAQADARAQAGLPRKLGAAAGTVLALVLL